MLTITYGYTQFQTKTISFNETDLASIQTSIIQEALDAVAGHAGGFVKLSAGTFTVTGTGKASDGALRIGSDTVLMGAGMGETIISLATGSTSVTGIVRTDSGGTNADGSIKTTSNVRIESLTIDGNKAGTTGDVDGFYCGPKPNISASDSNILLDRVEIMNVSRYGFDPHEQTIGLTITNSVSHHNGVDGFTIDNATQVTLLNNDAYANGRHGFNVVTGSTGVLFQDNDAWGNGQSGIVVQTGDNEIRAFTSDVSILGGQVFDNGRAGIDVRQANNVSISNVAISGNAIEGIILSGVDGASVANNQLSGNGRTLASGSEQIRVQGMLQDFGDTDAANDRYLVSKNITIDGVFKSATPVPSGVTLYGYKVTSGADVINGSKGRDAIAAGNGADKVYGNSGNDTLYGEDGADRLYGGTGTDILFGNEGDDYLIGDAGADTMTGGRGKDTYAFRTDWGTDTVTDFRRGTDKLDLTGVAKLSTYAQLNVSQSGADTKILFDGDTIVLKNVAAISLTATDFLL